MNSLLIVAAATLSFTRPEIVTATFESAADAEKAVIGVAPLPDGKKAAFTSRWDDSWKAHIERSKMFKRVGMQPMFFIVGGKHFISDVMPKIKANGGRFGNHTVHHPYLLQAGVNAMFREVMLEKILVETGCDMPNTSFVMPYGWSSSLGRGREAKIAKILVDAGIFVSSDRPLEVARQPASEWMPGNTFSANDSAPDETRYWRGIADGIAAVEKNPDYPKITFGIHSWCNPDGLLKQEQWLRKTIADHPEFWVTDDAHYGAYRYEFWHLEAKKLGVTGKTATFEVQRHDPAYLGEVQPLTYVFGDVKAVKVETRGGFDAATAMPEKIDVMKDGASEKFPGLKLKLSVDESKGALAYEFDGDAEVLQVVINPAPMWSEGRILAKEAKKSVKLGRENPLQEYQEGEHLYVVQVDFIRDGRRGRLYATESVAGTKAAVGGTPRDCTLVMGPMDGDHYDEAKWIALSVPEAALPDLGGAVDRRWRSMADRLRCGFSAAAYIPWDGGVPADFKAALKRATPKDRPFFLAAVDFICGADGEKDLIVNRSRQEKTRFYLNGRLYDSEGGEFRVPVKKGLNRLIYVWTWSRPESPQAFLLSVCDDKSVDKAVEFVTPGTVKFEKGLMESQELLDACFGKDVVPKVVLSFDDGFDEHHRLVAPILEKYGFRGVFNIITDKIGKGTLETDLGKRTYMTWDQIRDLQKRGHEIASHTLTHPNLSELAEKGKTDQLKRELEESRDAIKRETGVAPKYLCHPYCQTNFEVEEAIRDAGMIPMGTNRKNFGTGTVAWTKTGAGEYIRQCIDRGETFIDILSHGVTKEGHGWMPYEKVEDFEEHIKEIKKLADEGVIKVVLYRDL